MATTFDQLLAEIYPDKYPAPAVEPPMNSSDLTWSVIKALSLALGIPVNEVQYFVSTRPDFFQTQSGRIALQSAKDILERGTALGGVRPEETSTMVEQFIQKNLDTKMQLNPYREEEIRQNAALEITQGAGLGHVAGKHVPLIPSEYLDGGADRSLSDQFRIQLARIIRGEPLVADLARDITKDIFGNDITQQLALSEEALAAGGTAPPDLVVPVGGSTVPTYKQAIEQVTLGGVTRRREPGGLPISGRISATELGPSGDSVFNRFDRLHIDQAEAQFRILADQDLIGVQFALWEMGAYGDQRPSLGYRSQADEAAFRAFYNEHLANPMEMLDQTQNRMKMDAWAQRRNNDLTSLFKGADDGGYIQNIDITAASDIKMTANAVSQSLAGRDLTEAELNAFVPQYNDIERRFQRAAAARLASVRAALTGESDFEAMIKATQPPAVAPPGSLSTAYMQSPTSPSFSPEKWKEIVEITRMPAGTPQSPEMKEAAVRFLTAQLYAEAQDWGWVAHGLEQKGLGSATELVRRQNDLLGYTAGLPQIPTADEGAIQEIERVRESLAGASERWFETVAEQEIKGFAFANQARAFGQLLQEGGLR
jgi:hypothetical protein